MEATQVLAYFDRGKIKELLQRSDIMASLGLIGILMLMIVPLPAMILDLCLATNITIAILALIIRLYAEKAVEFSIFPSIPLPPPLFRLALNVASTRLILLHGNEGMNAAGSVIEAFGQFVVDGSYVVGLVIFVILVIINFIVITKGAGRIAEVAARFILDAMPGKQMTIDADLNAGLINEARARQRREEISAEANFHGAMDGASKFVRGDAIAGIIITMINIGAGFITAAGMLVTRSTGREDFGSELKAQFPRCSKALWVVSAILLGLALIPGLPFVPFLILSSLLAIAAYQLDKTERQKMLEQTMTEHPPQPMAKPDQDYGKMLDVDLIEFEVGYGHREVGSFLALEPKIAQKILDGLSNLLSATMSGMQPVLLVLPQIRPHVRRLTERCFPNLSVLSHNEVASQVRIQSIGTVTIDAS